MRLTLRTLLAYLDDMLEPNQAKEIGAKIAESNLASALVDRIREVMRRRRLGAPGLNDTPDPNTVAEYLDNTLPAEAVADLERICLESDVNLAEVAAAHQILTLVLGEPAEVPPWMRERIYALGPIVSPAAEGTVAAEGDGATTAAAAASNAPSPARTRDSFSQAIPDYLRPAPIWRRALPVAFVAAIAIAWIGLIWWDDAFRALFGGPPAEQQVAVAPAGQQPPAAPAGADVPEAPIEQPAPPEAVQPPAVAAVDGGVEPVAPDDEEELPAAVAAAPAAPAEPMPAVAEVAPAPAGQVEPIPALPAAVPPAAPAAQVEVVPPMKYESPAGIVLEYRDAEGDWFPLPREAFIRADQWLACPEPFDAEFDLGEGRAKLRLFGGTGIRYTAPPRGSDFALEIERGLLVIERLREPADDAAGANPAPGADPAPAAGEAPAAAAALVISLIVRDETWTVTLGAPGTRCAIEILPLQPTGFEQELGKVSYSGALYSVSGNVRFADGTGRERTADLSESEWMPLGPDERGVADNPHPLPAPQALAALPSWLDPQTPQLTSAVRRARALFEKEFEPNEPLRASLGPIVSTPEPLVSELAVKCLALAGRHSELAHALARSPHDESRTAAIVGLRIWLGQNPKQGDLLRGDLQRLFPPQTAELVYRLLWGYSPQDARDPVVSADLVRMLGHEDLAVRQLVYFHVRNLTLGRTFDYLPHSPPAQRLAAIMRWQRHIEKEGALVSPASP